MKLPEKLQFIANAGKPQKTTHARMDGRVCIITGSTSGVGYAAAKRLAEGGAHVVMVCRNSEKVNHVQETLVNKTGSRVDVLQADFSNFTDVRRTASAILETYPRIDVLINNAGIHNTRRILTEEGIEKVFYVNHLASFLFTRLLLHRIIESAPARIIQVNSQGHRFGGLDLNDLNWEKRRYGSYRAYGASKTAQLLTVWELADQLEGSGVTINAMHPGAVKTNIGMNNGLIYRLFQRYFLWWFLKDPIISGEAVYYFAAAPEMTGVSGKYFNLTVEEKPALHARDRVLASHVLQISEELTGLA